MRHNRKRQRRAARKKEDELTVSHGAWKGSRAEFAKWRDQLTLAAGYMIAVRTVGEQQYRLPLIDSETITAANWAGVWIETPADPLSVLINHSDSYGVIHPGVGDRDEVTFSEPVSTDLMDEERECGWSMSGGGTVDCAAAV